MSKIPAPLKKNSVLDDAGPFPLLGDLVALLAIAETLHMAVSASTGVRCFPASDKSPFAYFVDWGSMDLSMLNRPTGD